VSGVLANGRGRDPTPSVTPNGFVQAAAAWDKPPIGNPTPEAGLIGIRSRTYCLGAPTGEDLAAYRSQYPVLFEAEWRAACTQEAGRTVSSGE